MKLLAPLGKKPRKMTDSLFISSKEVSKVIRQKNLVAKKWPTDFRKRLTIFLPFIFLPFFVAITHLAEQYVTSVRT